MALKITRIIYIAYSLFDHIYKFSSLYYIFGFSTLMKDKLENTIEKPITWLNNNEEAEKDKYDNRKKLLEEIVNPIAMWLYAICD